MMQSVKQGIRTTLNRLGYVVTKQAPSPYPEIASVPRYMPQEIDLLGRRFKVADAASFLASYREIFVEEIYRFNAHRPNPNIIDCGANYGVSVLYFKNLYPEAQIKAIEADSEIFSILSRNIASAGKSGIELVNKAVSHNDEPLSFYTEGADGGRTHGLDSARGVKTIPAVTLDELIDGPVDFLKMDIEGAESSALAACTKLDQVEQMFIEYHSFHDSPQALGDLLSLLKNHGFRYYIHTQFCSRAPLTIDQVHMGMDLQLNIFVKRQDIAARH